MSFFEPLQYLGNSEPEATKKRACKKIELPPKFWKQAQCSSFLRSKTQNKLSIPTES